MTDLFQPLSMYERLAPSAFDASAPYEAATGPRGAWPSERGCPGATNRSPEPLVTELWRLEWEAPLAAARNPDNILIGPGVIVVSGDSARDAFSPEGRHLGSVARAQGAGFLDLAGERLLADHVEGGLFTHRLPSLERDGRIMLAYPTQHVTRTVLQGPDVLAILSVVDRPFGPPPSAVVEVVRVRDWDTGKRRVHYGLEPIAGIIREDDGKVHAAASSAGPVLATRDGIRWCDWRLRPLHEVPLRCIPRALSIDDNGRAYLLGDVGAEAHLFIVHPGAKPVTDIALPWPVDATFVPPVLGPRGIVFLAPPEYAWILDAEGHIHFRARRRTKTPAGCATANGMLLLSDAELLALTHEGEQHVLWNPPQALVAPPILVGERIYVASAQTLYALTMR